MTPETVDAVSRLIDKLQAAGWATIAVAILLIVANSPKTIQAFFTGRAEMVVARARARQITAGKSDPGKHTEVK